MISTCCFNGVNLKDTTDAWTGLGTVGKCMIVWFTCKRESKSEAHSRALGCACVGRNRRVERRKKAERALSIARLRVSGYVQGKGCGVDGTTAAEGVNQIDHNLADRYLQSFDPCSLQV